VKVEFSNRHLSINVVDRGDEQAKSIQKNCLPFISAFLYLQNYAFLVFACKVRAS